MHQRLFALKVIAPGKNCTSKAVARQMLRGHFISFFHNAWAQTMGHCSLLERLGRLTESFKVHLVGPGAVRDNLIGRVRAMPEMQLRPWVLCNYACLCSLTRPAGGLADQGVDGFGDVTTAATDAMDRLLAAASLSEDMNLDLHIAAPSDVSSVRQGVDGDDSMGDAAASDSGAVSVTRVGMMSSAGCGRSSTQSALEQLQKVLAHSPNVERGSNPINDFTTNDMLLGDGFWFHFLLGHRWLKKGSQPVPALKHMFMQYTLDAAHDIDFLLLLANQRIRHTTSRATNAMLKARPGAAAAFIEARDDPETPEKLAKAVANIESPEAEEMIKKLFPFITASAAQVPWSGYQRAACKGELWALSRRYGIPSIFFSISPDDVHNPRCIRLCLGSATKDNSSWPAKDEHDWCGVQYSATQAQLWDAAPPSSPSFDVPLPEALLNELADGNPVLTTICFQQLMEVVLEVFFGMPVNAHTRRTEPVSSRRRGVAGVPLAFYVVTELQGRKAMHKHGLFWGGAMPEVLANIAAYRELVEGALDECVDSLICHNLPLAVHLVDAFRRTFARQVGFKRAAFAPYVTPTSQGQEMDAEPFRLPTSQDTGTPASSAEPHTVPARPSFEQVVAAAATATHVNVRVGGVCVGAWVGGCRAMWETHMHPHAHTQRSPSEAAPCRRGTHVRAT